MAYKTILYERKGKIVYVTLNRPHILNALDDTMGEELIDAFKKFDLDEEAWVAILSGKGRAFCSGADVKQRQLRPRDEIARIGGPAGLIPVTGLLGLGQTVNWKPVIAAVHGYTIGAGYFLATLCDLVVAADDTKFQITEVKRGVGLGWSNAWFCGAGKFATEIATTGRFFSAQEAHQWGMVNRVVPPDQVMAEAEKMAGELNENPPLSVRANIRVARYYAQKMGEEELLYIWGLKLFLTEDFRESALAFVEKRKPHFKGR
ncbi:MAG: enoyl-CoA hydratase/isomerase family protein [Chloroflexi bacterium]|nr:enoyl-CoA hydratase/isomerase family protein [Chloroflexota bacterium]